MYLAGNHDSVPANTFYSDGRQSWQYEHLAKIWGADLNNDANALATLRRGGYYAAQPTKGLTVISLNVNYWAVQNPAASSGTEGAAMMSWFGTEMAAAEARGDAVHILGHQPPQDTGTSTVAGGWSWLPGYWGQYCAIISKHQSIVRGQFYGHIHIDQWTLTRECKAKVSYTMRV